MIERIPASDLASWLALRSLDVTASSAAALLNVHPFMSAYELWALKSGRISEDAEMTPAMERGQLLEPVAVTLLRRERPGWDIRHNTLPRQVYYRDASVRLGATPDIIAMDPERGIGVVQVKTVEPSIFRQKWHDENGDLQPPIWIVIQAIIEAKLTGSSWAAVAPLVVGFGVEMPIIDVPIHDGVYERIAGEVKAFWQRIADGIEPDPDYTRDDALLSRLGRGTNGEQIDLSADNMMPGLLEERAELKGRIKVDTDRCKEIEGEIVAKIGPHESAFVPGWKIARPVISRKGYSVEPTQFRQLKISQSK
jgi:predicted phage-related endonuclease